MKAYEGMKMDNPLNFKLPSLGKEASGTLDFHLFHRGK